MCLRANYTKSGPSRGRRTSEGRSASRSSCSCRLPGSRGPRAKAAKRPAEIRDNPRTPRRRPVVHRTTGGHARPRKEDLLDPRSMIRTRTDKGFVVKPTDSQLSFHIVYPLRSCAGDNDVRSIKVHVPLLDGGANRSRKIRPVRKETQKIGIRVHSQLPQIRGNGILCVQLALLGAEKTKERT